VDKWWFIHRGGGKTPEPGAGPPVNHGESTAYPAPYREKWKTMWIIKERIFEKTKVSGDRPGEGAWNMVT
jgi:hypothetical protein